MYRAVTVIVAMLMVLVGGETIDSSSVAQATPGRASVVLGSTASAPRPPADTAEATETTQPAVDLLHASSVVRIPPVALVPGDEGSMVAVLQAQLTEAGFYRSEIDGEFGSHTEHAVVAFHKAIDAERVTTWSEDDWQLLADYRPSLPDRPDEPDRLEIDLTRQLLYRFADGELADIIPISSGNGERYYNSAGNLVTARTPRGDYSFYRHISGWRISYLGALYKPWYFRGGYAIHGSNFVPPWPDSHGCVRVPNWEADHLAGELWLGLPIHVWDAPPEPEPPSFDIAWRALDRELPATPVAS